MSTPRPSANIVWKPTADGSNSAGGMFYVEVGGRWYAMRPTGVGREGSFAHHPAGSYEPLDWVAKPDPVGAFRKTFEETGPEKAQEPSEDPLEQIGAHLTDALASGAAELLHGAEKGLSAARKWLEDL